MMTEMVLVKKAISKVFADFVAKAVSDSVDVLKYAIKDADLDRKSYNQNLQTRLYQLIVDAINKFTYNKYEKQDKLYDAAESIIKGYIGIQDNVDAVKSGLKMLVSGVNDDTCQEFLETLCGEICGDDNSDLYKEIEMLWKRRESEYFRGAFAKIDQNDRAIFEQLNDLKEVLEFIKNNMSRQEDKSRHNRIPIVNRADEYAKKWNENVFLNNFNKRDKNAGVNIKLKELYLEEHLPHYVWEMNDEPLDDLRELLCEYTVDNDDKKMLLILGQAGIGKSTLITWIMANLVKKKDDIYIYQFASDLENIDWQGNDILNDVFKRLELRYDELENKVLILDGFDEIHSSSDKGKILNQIYHRLKEMSYLKHISLIITCRENYIDELEKVKCDHITLQTWDDEQIISFCEIYRSMSKRNVLQANLDMMLENKKVFGIPLMLYMVLALNISVERNASLVDIYDKIFAVDGGGIYDRCINNLSYGKEHRIGKVKQQIHHISQKIAFWMFENNAEKATIPQIEFKNICDIVMKEVKGKAEDIQSDVLIGSYFETIRHCEGLETDELQFVHRSIYEYFVVVYFFESINTLRSKEDIAGKLGELLKAGCLSEQILEFIKYKFDDLKGYSLLDSIKEIFNIMLRDGVSYYTEERYKNVIGKERKIFSNMVEIVGLWNSTLGEVDDNIISCLQSNRQNKLNLKGIRLSAHETLTINLLRKNSNEIDLRGVYLEEANLSGADLSWVDLSGAHLAGANLSGANLIGANLYGASLYIADLSGANLDGANLSGADLSRADLSGAHLVGADLSQGTLLRANLSGTNLSRADLRGADLSEADLSEVILRGVDLGRTDLKVTIFNEKQVDILCKKYDLSLSRVFLPDTDETVSYKEYCNRKQKK